MKVVTGGAGMIGSAIAQALNQAGHEDVLIVDDLTDGIKFRNISGLAIADYQDKDDFLAKLENDCELGLTAVFHQGACSSTTEWDGRYMMRENYSYSKVLLSYCQRRRIPVVYASSAAVYGGCDRFAEAPENEHPLNVYGYSKKLLDDHVRGSILSRPDHAPVVGLRYFNVYGPREDHKGSMASVAFHLGKQLENGDNPRLFGAHDGYGPGEQCRDFVHVDDVAAVALWCWNSGISGIYNCGTGRAESFRTVAETVIAASGTGTIEYVAFPDHLKRHYQSFTQADMSRLQAAGYNGAFRDVATGVREYVEWLQKRPSW